MEMLKTCTHTHAHARASLSLLLTYTHTHTYIHTHSGSLGEDGVALRSAHCAVAEMWVLAARYVEVLLAAAPRTCIESQDPSQVLVLYVRVYMYVCIYE